AGPQGAAGPIGPQGLQGPAGPKGDPGPAPDVSVFATIASLSPVAFSGKYQDLSGKPDLSGYATVSGLPWVDEGSYIYAAIAGASSTPIDQSMLSGSGCGAAPTSVFQSFTAGKSGPLAQVSLEMTAAKPGVTFMVRAGNGLGGTILHSSVVDMPVG